MAFPTQTISGLTNDVAGRVRSQRRRRDPARVPFRCSARPRCLSPFWLIRAVAPFSQESFTDDTGRTWTIAEYYRVRFSIRLLKRHASSPAPEAASPQVDTAARSLVPPPPGQSKHNITLRYPMLPCAVMTGKKCWVPLELCTVLPGQRKARPPSSCLAALLRKRSLSSTRRHHS